MRAEQEYAAVSGVDLSTNPRIRSYPLLPLMTSDYSIQMCRELENCEQQLERLTWGNVRHCRSVASLFEHDHQDKSIRDIRRQSLEWFQRVHLPSRTIPQYHINEISCCEFRRRFHQGNLPCLLRGFESHEFAELSTLWVSADGAIQKDWFVSVLGEDALVPVRKQSTGAMDQDGRAEECETLDYTILQWIHANPEPQFYLKDWHLMKELEEKGFHKSLYEVPEYFQRDILNEFLARVTGGDYKFVYWGPAGSQTPVHSDVLNSLSWSYNVVGSKLWKFYLPNENISIAVKQQAGESMFVPASWRHEVTNLVETLSINHNWATGANVDKLVDSVIADFHAVEQECFDWNIPVDDLEARESMLRGCAGLDIVGCFFLLLSSLLDVLPSFSSIDGANDDALFLVEALESLVKRDEILDLQGRLGVALKNESLALRALELSQELLSKFL